MDELSLKIEKQRSDDIKNIVSFTFQPLQVLIVDFAVPLSKARAFPLSDDGLALEIEESEPKRTGHHTKTQIMKWPLFGRVFGVDVWLKSTRSSSVTLVYELKIEQDQSVSKGVLHLKGIKRVKLAHLNRRWNDEQPIILEYKTYLKD